MTFDRVPPASEPLAATKPAFPRRRFALKALKDPDARVRRDAVRSLGQMGAAAKPALESIRPLLKDEGDKVRSAARTSLQQIEMASEPRP